MTKQILSCRAAQAGLHTPIRHAAAAAVEAAAVVEAAAAADIPRSEDETAVIVYCNRPATG